VAASVRFDDLTPGGGASFALHRPVSELVSTDLSTVRETVAAGQRAAEAGYWVAGWVGYEAAPAFDSALPIRPEDGSVASRLPFVWFGVFEERRPIAPPIGSGSWSVEWQPSLDADEYRSAVGRIRERIRAGDTYQVNFSFRLRGALAGDPLAFYGDLAHAQRGAYASYLATDRWGVACASPELFFRMDDGWLTTRPMKGTALRGRWPTEDLERAAAMVASPKERAENLMIVDLLRNDMGRISEFGTVAVERLFEAERYETVWQMTSTISSRLRDGVGLCRVLVALFPCGSVTGAPKASTMGIIAEMETARRGVYCGATGWLAPGAKHGVFAVGIRTAALDLDSGDVEYGVGGGITWDSSAAGEHGEAYAKARVLTVRRPAFDLLETLRWDDRGYWALEEHLDRLEGSADYFRFTFDRARVRRALLEAEKLDEGPARVRLTVDEHGTPTVTVAALQVSDAPVMLVIDEVPVDSTDPMLYHKTTARTRYEEALRRHRGADDVILVNQRGEVTETTVGNLLVEQGGRWCTPPLDAGLLPGIHRARLLESGEVEERALAIDDVARASRLAVVNSVRLWRPASLATAGGGG
jgi:para-aminobenzoate synthetase/4-amino-4-deoxychorismate lyase